MSVDVILPAAGSSERMKLPVEKQFLQVQGKHIIAYTVDAFHRLHWIRHIVVTVDSAQIDFTKTLMLNYGFDRVIVTAGSTTRHRSIFCGLNMLQQLPDQSDIVIIHDAARPLVPADIIWSVAEAARLHGAAGVTRPLVSTVIRADANHMLAESLDRRYYQNSEMPQAFRFNVIASAYEKCTEDDLDFGTECLLLALKYSNSPAFLVEGTDDLWKVTYQKDLYSLESVVKAKNTQVSVVSFLQNKNLSLDELYLALNRIAIQRTADEAAANTFVLLLDPLETLHLDELVTRISRQLTRLPQSAVNLRPLLLLIFVSHDPLAQPIAPTAELENHENPAQLAQKGIIQGSEKASSPHKDQNFTTRESYNYDLHNDTYTLMETKIRVTFHRLMELCSTVVKQIKLKLRTENVCPDFITTGVITKLNSLAVDEIVEIISLRSSCLDNQVLSYV